MTDAGRHDSPLSPRTLFSLEGRTALVTGGSRGIGAMIAEGLLAAGARVLIAARGAEQLEATAARLKEIGPCESIVADVSSADGAQALAAAAAERVDALHVLVNNAGATYLGSFEQLPVEEWEAVMATNVTGVQYLTTAALPLLRAGATEADPARIIVIGSTSGMFPSGLPDVAYGASKAAVHLLARQHAALLVREHILVNVIAPGLFETDMSSFLHLPGVREPVLSTIPMGRPGRAEEIAGAAVFLASRAGGYTTGEVLVVDGGRAGIGRADPVAGL